ncbi:MAG TPA: hypothetical protein GXX39_05770 [Syntrophothermus lipocalidus]|nr:hypothetical protein [Syntrophothermus lipocalidus]
MEVRISATDLGYRELNRAIRMAAAQGADTIFVHEVNGQYYLGAGMKGYLRLVVNGVPGNDLACYLDGVEIRVIGNAQDGVGNTMSSGRVIVEGSVGDVLGYGMRGGEIFVRDNVGYRAGIHMKEFADSCPVVVIGGSAGAFLGEYMAGGRIILLGLKTGSRPLIGPYCGSGMHGGRIFIREPVDPTCISRNVQVSVTTEDDRDFLHEYFLRYCAYFGFNPDVWDELSFIKLTPQGSRPYGSLYTGV